MLSIVDEISTSHKGQRSSPCNSSWALPAALCALESSPMVPITSLTSVVCLNWFPCLWYQLLLVPVQGVPPHQILNTDSMAVASDAALDWALLLHGEKHKRKRNQKYPALLFLSNTSSYSEVVTHCVVFQLQRLVEWKYPWGGSLLFPISSSGSYKDVFALLAPYSLSLSCFRLRRSSSSNFLEISWK